jgi:hypothetical protein
LVGTPLQVEAVRALRAFILGPKGAAENFVFFRHFVRASSFVVWASFYFVIAAKVSVSSQPPKQATSRRDCCFVVERLGELAPNFRAAEAKV